MKTSDQKHVSFPRFYFWNYSKSYGWRQHGRTDGYDTLTEARDGSDNCHIVESGDPYVILEGGIVFGNQAGIGSLSF